MTIAIVLAHKGGTFCAASHTHTHTHTPTHPHTHTQKALSHLAYKSPILIEILVSMLLQLAFLKPSNNLYNSYFGCIYNA